jgi:2-polyprenyl-3-methyl-5-hydroxy-6-metoxy-1,4-benzoquinol methylase
MKEKWDERYRQEEFAYGEEPNVYLKKNLVKLPVGSILFPAEGEGRNAVHAARQGWKTYAFDQSVEGQKKALALATKHAISIEYHVTDTFSLPYQKHQFEVIALIYAHFPAAQKSAFHKILIDLLTPGGIIIFEAFSKKHLEYVTQNEKVGGPKDLAMLFSIDEIKSDFEHFEVIELLEQEIELNEGLYHNGKGSVIRFIGRKK